VDVGLVRLRFAPGGRLVAPRTDDLGVALIYVEVGTITTRNTDPLMVMRGAQTPEQVPAETDVRLEAGDSLFAAPGSGGSSTTTGPGKRTSCSPSSRRSWPPRRPRSRSKQTRDEGRIAFRPSRSRVPSRHQRTPPFVKRVPVTPQLGISFSDFPLNCEGCRFQIMRIFPGYRNHFSRGRRVALFPSRLLVWKTRRETTKPQQSFERTVDSILGAFRRMLTYVINRSLTKSTRRAIRRP
jgi:hypothetical protein